MIWSIALCIMFANVIISSNELKNCEKKRQSPVNLSSSTAIHGNFEDLDFFGYSYFNTARMDIENNGHTVEVEVNKSREIPFISGGPLDSTYRFEQLHLHWGKLYNGSEHYVDGFNYAIEIHMVHFNVKYENYENAVKHPDGLCVIAMFGEMSKHDNPDIIEFIHDLHAIRESKEHIYKQFIPDFLWIFKVVYSYPQHYYTYDGSLTTEPYTECVKWIIFTKTFNISEHQLTKLRMLHSDLNNGANIIENDRPLQRLCGRQIFYH